MSKPKVLLLVDMSSVIRDNLRRKSLYSLFNKFTLHELIESILSVDPFVDYSSFVYDILESKIDEYDETFDRDLFQIYYESLMSDVDDVVRYQYREELDKHEQAVYLFEQWVDKTTIMLRLEP